MEYLYVLNLLFIHCIVLKKKTKGEKKVFVNEECI